MWLELIVNLNNEHTHTLFLHGISKNSFPNISGRISAFYRYLIRSRGKNGGEKYDRFRPNPPATGLSSVWESAVSVARQAAGSALVLHTEEGVRADWDTARGPLRFISHTNDYICVNVKMWQTKVTWARALYLSVWFL